jgi:hypothetical protein
MHRLDATPHQEPTNSQQMMITTATYVQECWMLIIYGMDFSPKFSTQTVIPTLHHRYSTLLSYYSWFLSEKTTEKPHTFAAFQLFLESLFLSTTSTLVRFASLGQTKLYL